MINKYINGILKAVNGVWELAVAGTDYLTPTGDGSGLTGIASSDSVTNITGDVTITAVQMTGRVKFYNSAQAAITLPVAAVGLTTTFEINHSGGVRFIRNGSDTFICGGVSSLTALPVGGTTYDIVVGGIYELTCYVVNVWTVKRKGVQPYIVARIASSQALTDNGITLLDFSTESTDNNNNYDAVNKKATPTVPGLYTLSMRLSFGNTGTGYIDWHLYKNGLAGQSFATHYGTTYTRMPVFWSYSELLNGTDYIEPKSDTNGILGATLLSSSAATMLFLIRNSD